MDSGQGIGDSGQWIVFEYEYRFTEYEYEYERVF